MKFILEEPGPDVVTADSEPQASSETKAEGDDTVLSEDLLVDQGRAYVSMEQIKTWHSQEEQSRFLRWIMYKTTALAANGMGFFLEDYDEWMSLDMPDSS